MQKTELKHAIISPSREYKDILVLEFVLNFIFYGFKSYIVMFLINRAGFEQKNAISLFTAFLSMSYITSFIGSYISDTLVGRPRALYVSFVFACLGLLAVASSVPLLMVVGLAVVSFGAGTAKPILASLLSTVSENHSASVREHRFRMFYTSLNAGAFCGPILASTIQNQLGADHWGWEAGLAVLSLSLMVIVGSMRSLLKARSFALSERSQNTKGLGIAILSFITLSVAFYWHQHLGHLITVVIIGSLSYLALLIVRAQGQERRNVVLLTSYLAGFVAFIVLFEQAGSSIMVFFDRMVDRSFGPFTVHPPMLLSLNPIFIVTLGLLAPKLPLSRWLAHASVAHKMSVGFLFVALGFAMLAAGAAFSSAKVSPAWIVSCVLLVAQGELLIAPVTLASISELSPKHLSSTFMTFWLMAIAYGVFAAGLVATNSLPDYDSPVLHQLNNYAAFFGKMSGFSCCIMAVLLVSSWLYRRANRA